MAIVVDKAKKRFNIANSCKRLLIEDGFSKITITKIAKTAGISKGSFYDYFENKEDLVFEVVSQLLQEYNKQIKSRLEKYKTTKDKTKALTLFFYKDKYKDLRTIYNQFAAISLLENNPSIAKFQEKNHDFYRDWLKTLIEDGIKEGELKEDSLTLVDGLFASVKGFYLSYTIMNKVDELENKINIYIDNIFNLIEEK